MVNWLIGHRQELPGKIEDTGMPLYREAECDMCIGISMGKRAVGVE